MESIEYDPAPDLTPAQEDAVRVESARQQTLTKGWHAVKDLAYYEEQRKYRWVWYVVYFERTGAEVEDTVLTARSKAGAESLAAALNVHKTKPALP